MSNQNTQTVFGDNPAPAAVPQVIENAAVLSDSNNRFYFHEAIDKKVNLIYRHKNTPAAIQTGVTAKSGVTGATGVTEATASNGSIYNPQTVVNAGNISGETAQRPTRFDNINLASDTNTEQPIHSQALTRQRRAEVSHWPVHRKAPALLGGCFFTFMRSLTVTATSYMGKKKQPRRLHQTELLPLRVTSIP